VAGLHKWASHRAGLAIFERLAAADSRNVLWQTDLANSYGHIAEVNIADGDLHGALANYRASHVVWERVVRIDPANSERQMELLWSHARLALLLDDPAARIELILFTLRLFKENGLLNAHQMRWLPFAEEANAALKLGDRDFQLVMLNIFWRSAPLTPNPVKQASLVVAMLRQLKKDNKLEPEHARWLSEAEAKLIQLRQN